jgi:Na+-driven multidrug efflux pump
MIEIGVFGGVALGLAIAALHTVLPNIFTPDPRVASLAAFILLIVAVLQPVNAIAFTLDGILIGAGDSRFLAWAMAAAFAVFLPAAIGVLLLDAGIGALWSALGLFMAVRSGMLLLRFRTSHWQVVGAG